MDPATALVVLGAEGHPPDSFVAQVATPAAILVFFGSTYLLVRSNLGTKRGYLVMATTFFGFMSFFSLFWAFGGWGTPDASGPRQLPGQELDHYVPRWIPFAVDSRLAQQEDFQAVADYPDGWTVYESVDEIEGEVGEERFGRVEDGIGEIRGFFAEDEVLDGQEFGLVGDLWEPIEIGIATEGDQLLMAVTYQEFDEENFELVEDGETYAAFGYFEEGAPLLPSFVFFGIAIVLFVLHLWLLDRDERLERRDRERTTELEEPERVPEPA